MAKDPNSMNGRRQQPSNPTIAVDEGHPLLRSEKARLQYPPEEGFVDDNESEAGRRDACRGMSLTALSLFLILFGLRYATTWFFQTEDPASTKLPKNDNDKYSVAAPTVDSTCPDHIPFCHPDEKLQHVSSQKGFPSFWDYAIHGAITVTYDGRSFLLNNERALFLGGSMHAIRATKETWEQALDAAVRNGLNLITIYVFWAEHQPLPGKDIDWTLPAGRGRDCSDNGNARPSYCGWSLADAIRAAALRGLFVHARIGPYVCAEYNYGGIPEWVPLNTNMQMRRLDPQWLDVMEGYVTSTIHYLTDNKLFAYQGGPIIAGQIENELGEEDGGDDIDIPIMDDDMPPESAPSFDNERRQLTAKTFAERAGNSTPAIRRPLVQDYADWCGSLVQRLAPRVVWTMCNGLSASNTIVTCNGDCSTKWLEGHGSSGRIQVDQPPLWSEDEGGFQIWGDDAQTPSDYFWGRTARAMSFDALRWFARGGTHLNYYMFWGAYNRGRSSASGIMNAYATDAPVCSSGEPRQPKFGHFEALHRALQHVTPILLEAPSALNKSVEVEHKNEGGDWEKSGEQRMFVYRTNHTRKINHEIAFVENDSKRSVIVKLVLGVMKKETLIFEMSAYSAILIQDGAILFDSFNINVGALAYARKFDRAPIEIHGWSSCAEPIGAPATRKEAVSGYKPVEQTLLNIDAGVSSDYAWYETEFRVDLDLEDASIYMYVESRKGSALTLYMNGDFQGEAYNHQHAEGNNTFQFRVRLRKGRNKLAILSESLGFNNLIGRWGASTVAKVKGITGDVILASKEGNQSLVGNGLTWISSPGLHGAEVGSCPNADAAAQRALDVAQWSTATFNTPSYDPKTHSLFLNITLGRGHVWLNDHDMGRFWNVTRGQTAMYSQQFYFLPIDYLALNGGVNNLVFFDALGNDLSSTQLVLSWLEETDFPNFKDEVDFSDACI